MFVLYETNYWDTHIGGPLSRLCNVTIRYHIARLQPMQRLQSQFVTLRSNTTKTGEGWGRGGVWVIRAGFDRAESCRNSFTLVNNGISRIK